MSSCSRMWQCQTYSQPKLKIWFLTGVVTLLKLGSAIGEVHKVHVISESYEGDGVHYRVRAPESAIERIRAMLR